MSTITQNILNGAQAAHSLSAGYAITRVCTVSGILISTPSNIPPGMVIVGGKPTDVQMFQIAEYILEKQRGIKRGSVLSQATDGTQTSSGTSPTVYAYLDQLVPKLISANSVKFDLIYKGVPKTIVEVDTVLSQVTANVDKDGAPLVLSYGYPTNYKGEPRYSAQSGVDQGGEVPVSVPETTLTYKFTALAGHNPLYSTDDTAYKEWQAFYPGVGLWAENPPQKIIALMAGYFVGRVNKYEFNPFGLPGAPRTWMVTKLGGSSKDGGTTVDGVMILQYRERTWDPYVAWIDPVTGHPPIDLIENVGKMYFKFAKECTIPTLTEYAN